jgi:hypothetical protein
MKQLYVQGIFNEIAGRRDQAVADLRVLLDNPVGLGDHGNISEEIKKRLSTLDNVDSLLSTFQKYFANPTDSNNPNPQPAPSQPSQDLPERVLDEGE